MFLIFGQDIDGERFGFIEKLMANCALIHTDQEQQRIQGDRSDSVRRHPTHITFTCHGDNRHPRWEASNELSILILRQRHSWALSKGYSPSRRPPETYRTPNFSSTWRYSCSGTAPTTRAWPKKTVGTAVTMKRLIASSYSSMAS